VSFIPSLLLTHSYTYPLHLTSLHFIYFARRRVKILKKTKDETPDQRSARKTQERQRRETRERRESRASMNSTGEKTGEKTGAKPPVALEAGKQNMTMAEGLAADQASQLAKLGIDMDADGDGDSADTSIRQSNSNLNAVEEVEEKKKRVERVITMSPEEWTFLISDMYLARKGFIWCIKVMNDECDTTRLTHFFRSKEKKSAKREEHEFLEISPFAGYLWFSSLFGALMNLESTKEKADYKKANKFTCNAVDYLELTEHECDGLANSLQAQLRKCVRIQTAYDNWLEIFPCMKKLDKEQEWMRPLCMVFCRGLKNELRKVWGARALILFVCLLFTMFFYDSNWGSKVPHDNLPCFGCYFFQDADSIWG